MEKIDSIIFDLDGTLWDSTEIELKAINYIIEKEYDVSTITIEQLKSVMGYPLPEASEILFNKANKEIGIEILKKSGIIMDEYLRDCNSNLLYDKVKETINMLNNKYRLFIVSNCKVGYIETFLRTQNLTEIFKDYECNGKTGLSKGQNIKLIMDRNSIKNAVYVGDTIKDKEASEYARIPFVYASYGFGKVTEYDYKLNNIEDLVKILN